MDVIKGGDNLKGGVEEALSSHTVMRHFDKTSLSIFTNVGCFLKKGVSLETAFPLNGLSEFIIKPPTVQQPGQHEM